MKEIQASPYTSLFFIEYQLNPSRNDYNIVFDQTITGELDIIKLQNALYRLIRDHRLLDSHLFEKDKILYWKQNKQISPLKIFDNIEQQNEFVRQPFDLENGPLYRFGLFKINSKKYDFILVLHHVVIDGRDYDEFLKRISNYYNDSNFSLRTMESQAQAILSCNKLLRNKVNYLKANQSKIFWKKALANLPKKNALSCLGNREQISKKHDLIAEYRFEADLSTLNITQSKFDSIFNILILAWGILIAKYSSAEQAHISYPIGIKEGEGLELGAQINTIILPISFSNGESFFDMYQHVINLIKKFQINKKYKHSYLPTIDIMAANDIEILNVAFSQTNLKTTKIDFLNCETRINHRYNIDIGGAAILLSYQNNKKDKITFSILYDNSQFNKDIINEIYQNYLHILKESLTQPNIPLLQLSITSPHQHQRLLYNRSCTTENYHAKNTISQLFEAQVKKTPNQIALIHENKSLTYQELNQKANKLARHIRKQYFISTGKPLLPDTLIALYFTRGLEVIIAILAVLKSGGVYVPISPEYPAIRSQYLLQDTEAKLVLTQLSLLNNLRQITKSVRNNRKKISYCYIAVNAKIYDCEDNNNLTNYNTPSDLAYVIYTSGTTGKPKGVMQPHNNLAHLFHATQKKFNFGPTDVWIFFHSYVFDFSVWEIWGALLYGGKLIIPTDLQIKDLSLFHQLCVNYKITVLNQTPTVFYQFSEIASKQNWLNLSALRYIIFGGEALNISRLKQWWDYSKKYKLNTELINMYGITETTIHVTFKHLTPNEKVKSNIGEALQHLHTYVLDANFNPVPRGVIGELYVSGLSLARGYLNLPKLTQERFINNPFVQATDIKQSHTRLYKTGDLVRYLPNNNLEYIGRNDLQVKIYGYRIELEEIENALLKISDIQQSVVTTFYKQTENTEAQQLVAYYVAKNILDTKYLIKQLKAQLPHYMIPNLFIRLKKLPLSINGKLDRKMLPIPNTITSTSYVSPRNAIENILCNIWQDLLGIKKIGIYDDFFRIGGDSIISIRLVSQLKDVGLYISVAEIFENRTIARLANIAKYQPNYEQFIYHHFSLINKNQINDYFKFKNTTQIEDIYPTSYLQMGILLEAALANNGTYHNIFVYKIYKPLKLDRIISIWTKLVKRHPLLRTAFMLHYDYGYCGIQYHNIILKHKIKKISIKNIASFINQEKSLRFNISKPGLFRIYLFSNTDNEFYFIFSTHHVIEDGWSVASLIAEFGSAYLNNTSIASEILPHYGEFVAYEQQIIKNNSYKKFWHSYLQKKIANVHQSTANTLISDKSQIEKSTTLNKKLSRQILNCATRHSVSPDIIFMAAYTISLTILQKTKEIIFGIVVNNRLEKTGGDKMFGLYLNTLPMHLQLNPSFFKNKTKFIQAINNEKTKLYQYKHYPYGKIKEELKIQGDIFDCAFNYIHFHISEKLFDSKVICKTHEFEQTNIPLTLHVVRHGGEFMINLKGLTYFINDQMLYYLLNNITYLLSQLVAIRNKNLQDIRDQLLQNFPKYTRSTLIDNKKNNTHISINSFLLKKQSRYSSEINNLQKKILSTWIQVLNHTDISIDDNFFDVGGNSIRVLSLQSVLQKKLNITISITDLFRYPTIRKYICYLVEKYPELLTNKSDYFIFNE